MEGIRLGEDRSTAQEKWPDKLSRIKDFKTFAI